MKTMPAGEFKARCLGVMDEVRKRRQPIVITKRGRPVVKVVPVDDPTQRVFGSMRGKLEIKGDIVGPVVPPSVWKALR